MTDIKQELSDYGIMDMNGSLETTRAYLLNAVGIKDKPTFKDICVFLINNEKIIFDSPVAHRNYQKYGSKIGFYWHSSEIKENLETLQECGLIEVMEGKTYITTTYELTPEGKTLFDYIAAHTQIGDFGICPKCNTDMFNEYGGILCSNETIDPEKPFEGQSKNIKVTGIPQVSVNGRKYHKLTIDYTCKHCGHKWQEEDIT